jgi:hypothetical protein
LQFWGSGLGRFWRDGGGNGFPSAKVWEAPPPPPPSRLCLQRGAGRPGFGGQAQTAREPDFQGTTFTIVFASRIPPRLLRTRGLVVKSCADPVWKLSFVSILGHWPHIGPIPGTTLGCLWGPGGLPKGARRLPRDNFRRPTPCPWSAFGVPLGAGPPDGG